MEKRKISVFAVVMGQLFKKESKGRLMPVETWDDIDRAMCPKKLIRAIKATHTTAETGVKLKDKYMIRTEYYSMHQEPTETLARFKDQAIDFIMWLDPPRYQQLQMDLDNNAVMNIAPYPTGLLYQLSETDVSGAVPQQSGFAAVKTREVVKKQREVLSKKKKAESRKGNRDIDTKQDDGEKLERFLCSLCKERTQDSQVLIYGGGG